MKWPEAPTCHSENDWPPAINLRWREPDTNSPFRTCSYCGCIHPEDLLKLIEGGARLSGSDWKYGWPHKFYLHSPFAKWYNQHLTDTGYGEIAKQVLLKTLHAQTGIELTVDGTRVGYKAPHPDYQR